MMKFPSLISLIIFPGFKDLEKNRFLSRSIENLIEKLFHLLRVKWKFVIRKFDIERINVDEGMFRNFIMDFMKF